MNATVIRKYSLAIKKELKRKIDMRDAENREEK